MMAVYSLLGFASLSNSMASVTTQRSIIVSQYTFNTILGGVISMENMILHVILDDPNDQIQSVSIYNDKGQLEYQSIGCGAASCNYNCSELSTGIYEVEVETFLHDSFSGTIFIE